MEEFKYSLIAGLVELIAAGIYSAVLSSSSLWISSAGSFNIVLSILLVLSSFLSVVFLTGKVKVVTHVLLIITLVFSTIIASSCDYASAKLSITQIEKYVNDNPNKTSVYEFMNAHNTNYKRLVYSLRRTSRIGSLVYLGMIFVLVSYPLYFIKH